MAMQMSPRLLFGEQHGMFAEQHTKWIAIGEHEHAPNPQQSPEPMSSTHAIGVGSPSHPLQFKKML